MLNVIIITKNEEKNIRDCLKSIKNIADEIIIVDSSSNDKTLDIAKKYTDKIYLKRFENDFSRQRNFALTKAKGDWVLSIDADERISKPLHKIIAKLVKTKKYKGYLIPRRNYISEKVWLKHGLFHPDYQLRLFSKKNVKYINKLHEYPNIEDKYLKKTRQYLIHNSSKTKYNSFFSITRLNQFVQIEAENLLDQKNSSLIYVLRGIQMFIKYFFDSFIIGKGYMDGFNGFRAALIFSLFPIISSIYAILMRYKIIK